MIIGSMFLMPCPISGFLPTMVTTPSAAMVMNASGESGRRRAAELRERFGRVEVKREHHPATGERGGAQEGATGKWVRESWLLLYSAARAVCVVRAVEMPAARLMASRMRT